jgi:hypothetical protein
MKLHYALGLALSILGIGYAQDSLQTSAQRESGTKSQHQQVEELQIAVQDICPVTGKQLGSMGRPFKVRVGEQVAFLCCQGCQTKKIDPAHWTTIQKRIADAQSTCPIMDKTVDPSMESTVVEGQRIFVCCPPCIEKIQSKSETAIAKVQASYAKFVASEKRSRSDELHARAQAICPVSGNKLGTVGKPVKMRVGKLETAFVCSADCLSKKIKAEYWREIQENLAAAQGVCPIMENPVNSSMKSTVVQGRKIFVCCPPCIEKIQSAPDETIDKINQEISQRTQLQP